MKRKSNPKELQAFIISTLEKSKGFVKSHEISEMWNNLTGSKTQSSTIRQIVHEIRSKKISPIIANWRGYKIATTKREIQEEAKRLEGMIFEIMDALTGMESMASNLSFNFKEQKPKGRKSKFAVYSPIFEKILEEIANGGKILSVLKKYNVSYQKISKEDKIKMREVRFSRTIPTQIKKRKGKSEIAVIPSGKKTGRPRQTAFFSDVSEKVFEELRKGRKIGDVFAEYNLAYHTLTEENKKEIRAIKYPHLVSLD